MIAEHAKHQGREHSRRRTVGLTLATIILSAWATLHIYLVFHFVLVPTQILLIIALVFVQCWLYVGLFIIAHDCMHGSLAPGSPFLNRTVGRLCLFIYAGFDFDRLSHKHQLHHKFSGTEGDPDFDAVPPHNFGAWYLKFFFEYFSWRELAIISVAVAVYLSLLGAQYLNLLLFWALPALLSSVQLFTFGTYLPHRPGNDAFIDRHRTRSNEFNWLVSLLTCFHFGYHHAHHLQPGTPWWLLPKEHRNALRDDNRSVG